MRRTIGLAAINGAFIASMALLAPVFLSGPNINAVLTNMALEAIAMAGLTLLLVGRLFDLSVDGTVAVAGVVAGKLMQEAGWSPVAAIAVALSIGLGVGGLNGWLVMRMKINPLIATLGTWWILTGVAFGLTKSVSPYGFPAAFQALGQARVMGVRVIVWYAVVILLVLAVVLAWTRYGRHIYIMGGNPEAGQLFGVPVEKMGVSLFVLMGGLSAFVGIVLAARLNSGAVNAVDGMAMRAIAAAVIGGCALSGGKGNVLAGLLGLLLLNMLTNAATILGVSPYWQKSLIGLVLLLALLADAANGKVSMPQIAAKFVPYLGHKGVAK